MILRKMMENGKETFERISLDEALASDPDALVFTDEDDKREYEYIAGEGIKQDKAFSFQKNGRHLHININLPRKLKEHGKLVAMLPFMEDEDIHELVNRVLSGQEGIKDLPLVAMMPFLEDDDCDRLFLKCVSEDGTVGKGRLIAMAPFVSEKCLSKLVDDYISGRYPDLQLDELYPFMDSKDVKRLFEYRILKRSQQQEN
jgi:hypothetical protein